MPWPRPSAATTRTPCCSSPAAPATTPRCTPSTSSRSGSGKAAGLVSPSTMTAYGARPDFRGVLMIAVSQSGGSPDLVRSLEVARDCGALTVAVTNNAASDLARAADRARRRARRPGAGGRRHQVLHRAAARAAPAARPGRRRPRRRGRRAARPRRRPAGTPRGDRRPRVPLPLRPADGDDRARLLVPDRPRGRAEAHGDRLPLGAGVLRGRPAPRAARDDRPAGAGAGRGRRRDRRPRDGPGAAAAGRAGRGRLHRRGRAAGAHVVLPAGAPEELSPLLEILPFQLLALHVAVERGGDPDAPRGLAKVTETL